MDEPPDEEALVTNKMLKAGITKDNPWPATEEDLAPRNWRLSRFYCAPDGLHTPCGLFGSEQVVERGAIRHTSIKTHIGLMDGAPDSFVLLIEIWAGTTQVVKPFGWNGTTRRDRVERAMQAINDWRDCWQAQQP